MLAADSSLFIKQAHRKIVERSTFCPPTNWENMRDKRAERKDIIEHNKHHRMYGRTKRNRRNKLRLKHLKIFTFICGKDIPKSCTYRTFNLTRIGNLNRRRNFVHSVNMKRDELAEGAGIPNRRVDFAVQKVLPVTEASFTSSTEKNDQCVTTETNKDQSRGNNKRKHISRMKELLRWAVSAAKTEKRGKFNDQRVIEFQGQENTKSVQEEDQLSIIESPKISFSCDVESRSTTSSIFSVTSSEESGHFSFRRGNWITTDSEFVVLEL